MIFTLISTVVASVCCLDTTVEQCGLVAVDDQDITNEVLKRFNISLTTVGGGSIRSGLLEFYKTPSSLGESVYIKIKYDPSLNPNEYYQLQFSALYVPGTPDIYTILVNEPSSAISSGVGIYTSPSTYIRFFYSLVQTLVVYVGRLGVVTGIQAPSNDLRLNLYSDVFVSPVTNVNMQYPYVYGAIKPYTIPSNFNRNVECIYNLLKKNKTEAPCVPEDEIGQMRAAAAIDAFSGEFGGRRPGNAPMEVQTSKYFGNIIGNFKDMEKHCGESVSEIVCIFEAIVAVEYTEKWTKEACEPVPIAYEPTPCSGYNM